MSGMEQYLGLQAVEAYIPGVSATFSALLATNAELKAEVERLRKSAWISTQSELPENQKPVLVVGKLHDRYRVVMIAYYVRRWTLSADNYNDDANDADYNPETDKEYTPQGWYENTESYEFHMRFEGTVTHWMPLPVLPEVQP